jgi:uncharacterized protein
LYPVSDLRVEQIIQRCKAVLVEQYDVQLKGVILYGSMARGDSTEQSDIDLLVLLEKPFDFFVELRRLVDILYPIQLESDKLISAKPVSMEDFEKGTVSLYRIARREGVFIK